MFEKRRPRLKKFVYKALIRDALADQNKPYTATSMKASRKRTAVSLSKYYREFGLFLKNARLAEFLTQKDVAEYLGYLTVQILSDFENGRVRPPLGKLGKLIKLYKLDAAIVNRMIMQAEGRVLSDKLEGKPTPAHVKLTGPYRRASRRAAKRNF